MTPKMFAFAAITTYLIWTALIVRLWLHWVPTMLVEGYYLDIFMMIWAGIGALSLVGLKFHRIYYIKAYGVEAYIRDVYPTEILEILRDHARRP